MRTRRGHLPPRKPGAERVKRSSTAGTSVKRLVQICSDRSSEQVEHIARATYLRFQNDLLEVPISRKILLRRLYELVNVRHTRGHTRRGQQTHRRQKPQHDTPKGSHNLQTSRRLRMHCPRWDIRFGACPFRVRGRVPRVPYAPRHYSECARNCPSGRGHLGRFITPSSASQRALSKGN